MSLAHTDVTTTSERRIKPLGVLVANQIAAGEVIERPASVVKELVDNAIDAGAARIAVRIEQGGVELIEVSDDGAGIRAEDLPLAVAPHATSKIESAQDLERITSMGFRGEALASIASVSRLSIRSRTASEQSASVLEIEGATVGPISPEAGAVGSRVRVRNLFFNTPARRKFLRTTPTEQSRCIEVVRDLALAHPMIGFAFEADGKPLLEVPPEQGPRARTIGVLGPEIEKSYIEVSADEFDDARGVALWGMTGLPELARPHLRIQHVLLNGRPVRDRTIQHALKEGFRGLIEPGKHPAAVLLLQMDPSAVDVNVHPAKAEVRFRDSGMIHSAVLRAVRRALGEADVTPEVRLDDRSISRPSSVGIDFPSPARSGHLGTAGAGESWELKTPRAAPSGGLDFASMRSAMEAERARASEEPEPALASPARPADRYIQVHESYLALQDEQGLLIIDQHALHERAMFQLLIDRIESAGALESQRLLMPHLASAAPERIEALESLSWLLAQLGIEAEPIGPGQVAVHAFPTLLFERKVEPGAFLAELLEIASRERWDRLSGEDAQRTQREAALHEVLDMMACKAAVKAGDRLSGQEIERLLSMRDRIERSSNCPHGRPTTVRLTIRELERLFKRS